MALFTWTIHGHGRRIEPGTVVGPSERLSWPRTIGIGMQHVVAMSGATFLVPLITEFPPATTLFFSAIGTILFLVITGNKLPSYLGSSFAFLAPIAAAKGSDGNFALALGGIVLSGIALAAIGLLVMVIGSRWIDRLMPPIVTGTIVALIGFNLAPAAWNNVSGAAIDPQSLDALSTEARESMMNAKEGAPVAAVITLVSIVLVTVLFKGLLGRLSILVGVAIGYLYGVIDGQVDFSAIEQAAWFGLPQFQTPRFTLSLVGLFLPVVFVLMAENIGHVKSVAAMTEQNLDHLTGRALFADGLATTIAGSLGGSGTTTYAENIGVMAATRVYSTAAYWVAGGAALGLSLVPKFGEAVATVPVGVLGGAGTVLYGMIGILGARIWVQNSVDFSDPVNLTTAAIPLVIGIANFTWSLGDLDFEGIALGTAAALVIYHLMRQLSTWRGTGMEPASPASAPTHDEAHYAHKAE